MSAADGFGLACKACGQLFADDVVMGVVAAHVAAEHGEDAPLELDLVILCDRCGKAMEHLATFGNEHHYQCEPCHRGRVISQGATS